jgi:hypothetical protein
MDVPRIWRGRFSMARILVMNEKQDRILLDEYVHPVHIEDEHAAQQILERLAWAVNDAYQPDPDQYALRPWRRTAAAALDPTTPR